MAFNFHKHTMNGAKYQFNSESLDAFHESLLDVRSVGIKNKLLRFEAEVEEPSMTVCVLCGL